jgi:hypothetical protein
MQMAWVLLKILRFSLSLYLNFCFVYVYELQLLALPNSREFRLPYNSCSE